MDRQQRYEAIKAKEAELERREEALRKNNVDIVNEKPPNFPPHCPFVRHDIAADIPIEFITTMKIAFVLFCFTSATLFINLISCGTTVTIKVGKGKGYSLGYNLVFGILYFLLTIPLAFKINYYRLYTQCTQRNVKMTWFALEGIYIAFHAYASAGVKNSGLIGLIALIDALSAGSGAAKCFCTISGLCWLIATAGQVFLFGNVMKVTRGPAPAANNSPYSPVIDN
ncbi:hypothetical protein M9Y10_002687 [Tritrichomonas musculus]|uniref:Secretory carrier membrane protein n=1 Tax=Tritrichomonas musculus TaxID=1915356 RepID=A0ABR2LAI3_9EUKA